MGLAASLKIQRERLQTLSVLLEQEREQLSTGDIDGEVLTAIAKKKQKLLDALDHFEQQRRQASTHLGYSDNYQGDMQAARDANCLDLWQDIRQEAQDAARQNEVNGELLQLRMTTNQRLLNDIQKITGKYLYDSDGQSKYHDPRLSSKA